MNKKIFFFVDTRITFTIAKGPNLQSEFQNIIELVQPYFVPEHIGEDGNAMIDAESDPTHRNPFSGA